MAGTGNNRTTEHWNNSTIEGRKKKQDQGTGNVLPCFAAARNENILFTTSPHEELDQCENSL
ncbi:MAG: hypothetical protein V8T87_03525 [Victivallales bacterium]